MVLLYEPMIWEKPIPRKQAPPKNIPAGKKLSSSPSWWPYLLAFGLGLFVGLPVGREIIKLAAEMTESEIKSRVEAARARRGL